MSFITLLIITFLVATIISFFTARAFRRPIDLVLERIVPEEVAKAWSKFVRFAIYLAGISWGVDLWKLERYITPEYGTGIVDLTTGRRVFEVYRSIIETFQGIAWVLTAFFVYSLVALVIIRIFELHRRRPEPEK